MDLQKDPSELMTNAVKMLESVALDIAKGDVEIAEKIIANASAYAHRYVEQLMLDRAEEGNSHD